MASKGGPTTETTTQQVSYDPNVQQRFLDLVNEMGGIDFQQYGGDFASGMTPDERAALDQARGLAQGGGAGAGMLQDAAGLIGEVGGYTPEQVRAGQAGFNPVDMGGLFAGYDPTVQAGTSSAGLTNAGNVAQDAQTLGFRGDVRDLSAGLAAGGIEQYMNPFQAQVMDQVVSDAERARIMADQNAADIASREGAFGGSRHAILEAENARNFMDTVARTSANLGLEGFGEAAGLSAADQERLLRASGQNQQADIVAAQEALRTGANIGLQNAANRTQTGIANAANTTQANIATGNNLLRALGMGSDVAMFNAANALGADQFNVNTAMQAALANQGAGLEGAGLRLGAGNALAGVGNMLDANTLRNLGFFGDMAGIERGITDTNLQGGYNEFLRGQNFDFERLMGMGNLLNLMPTDYTQTGTTPLYQPNPLQGVAGGAATGFGLGGPVGAGIGGAIGLLGSFF